MRKYLKKEFNLSFSDDISTFCGQMEQPVGTISIRKQPTPSTWKGAWMKGRVLNQAILSILCMMKGRASIPGAAIATREATTCNRCCHKMRVLNV